MFDIIAKKRHGEKLTDGEIKFFVDGYTHGDIPDYQASALCMAICCRGMDEEECSALTYHMMNSGDTVDLSALPCTADKHSTGGVGDLTSLVVAPTLATLGVNIAKMSGRGLGHTGGTIDKLESIPGFCTSLTGEQFMKQVSEIGVAIIGQTADLAPADKKLYALRDVTATVESLPLIASSIMSKKLAAGAETIVLDVKYGSGAFMKTAEDAVELAEAMVKIGRDMGRRMGALVTSMEFPLGRKIGNTLEVIEAVEILRGEIGGDAKTVCVNLAANILSLAKGIEIDDAFAAVNEAIDSGKAYEKFLAWIAAQGGDISYIIENRLPVGKFTREVVAACDGYVCGMDTERVGLASCILGAGRVTKDDEPDLTAGLVLHIDLGEKLTVGQKIATLYTSDSGKLESAEEMLISSLKLSETVPENTPKLIYKIIR
ncbi:MAG: thymidine phosphorylase [Ruminococcaceae bacterium]|nr:thymidine phosphorylase [Oscillospiraceae bacterium]